MTNKSAGSDSTGNALVRTEVTGTGFSYIRVLSEAECRHWIVLKIIQERELEVQDVFGVFREDGQFIDLDVSRSFAAELSEELGYKPQLFLI